MNYILVTETLVLLIAASISPEKMLICCRLVVHAPQQIPGGFIHYQTLQLMFKLCQQEKKKLIQHLLTCYFINSEADNI